MTLPTFAVITASLLAHVLPGDHGGSSSFAGGFAHPLHGPDHVLAMFAVGLWAAQIGGRALWAVPAAFVSLMVLGGALGIHGVPLPAVETGIALSVLLLGLLIAFAVRLPAWAGALLVGLFAVFHGHAHGTEMIATDALFSAVPYCAGFVLATVLLHVAGIGVGLGLRRAARSHVQSLLVRGAGVVVALGGAYLLAAVTA